MDQYIQESIYDFWFMVSANIYVSALWVSALQKIVGARPFDSSKVTPKIFALFLVLCDERVWLIKVLSWSFIGCGVGPKD